MDITENLPSNYFSNSNTNLEENIDGNDIDLIVDNSIDFGDDYKMLGEEPKNKFSVDASKPKVSKSSVSNNRAKQATIDADKKSDQKQNQVDNDILKELQELDTKISSLEQSLNPPTPQQENKTFNNTYSDDKSSTVNVVNKDFFNEQNLTQIQDNALQEENTKNISNQKFDNIENDYNKFESNEIKNIENIKNQIFELKNTREKMLDALYYNNSNFKNITNSLISDNNTKVFVDNFTPDIFNEEKLDAIDNSIKTENVFGNNPEVVFDSLGEPAVISKDQIDLRSAIQEHGSLDRGLKDSAEQQDFVSNFATDKNVNNIFDNNENVFTNYANESNENITSELRSDNNLDLVKNTRSTVDAINNLSKQFNSLAKAITNGFNNVNGKIKEISYSQNNTTNNTYNQSSQPSNIPLQNNISVEDSYISTEIRGNTPIADHFPKGFDLNKLGSNLTNRI